MKKEEIAKYAYENISFYQSLAREGKVDINKFDSIPIIDKTQVLKNRDRFFSPEYIKDLVSDKLEKLFTSGSTGTCLEIFWNKTHSMKSLMPLWQLRKEYYDIEPNDKRVYFFTTKIENYESIKTYETKYSLGFSKVGLTEEKMLDVYKRIQEYNPKWMMIQPSLLAMFMKVIHKNGLGKIENLRLIEYTGERMSDSLRKQVEEFFGCNIASQYGAYEVNSIAYECPHGHMHVLSDSVFVEIVEEDNICLTSLQNKAMPFIRYKIGDRGSLDFETKCTCGNTNPILTIKKSRENDMIQYKDGNAIHSDVLYHVIETINLNMEHSILQFQIVMEAYENFTIYFVLEDDSDRVEVERMFLDLVRSDEIIGNFNFVYVDNLFPSEKTGKFAWFVSKVDSNITYK